MRGCKKRVQSGEGSKKRGSESRDKGIRSDVGCGNSVGCCMCKLRGRGQKSLLQTLIMYERGFNQNYYTVTLI